MRLGLSGGPPMLIPSHMGRRSNVVRVGSILGTAFVCSKATSGRAGLKLGRPKRVAILALVAEIRERIVLERPRGRI